MAEILQRVSSDNGRWQEVLNQWDKECEDFEENFAEYEQGTLSILRPLAEQTQSPSSGVYGVKTESGYLGVCQLNVTHLPGFNGRVLRVRHIIHSPKFDYDDNVSVKEYESFLISVFLGVFELSYQEMEAPHIKFHFRSPAERGFFKSFESALSKSEHFQKVAMRGSWLYISKK